MKAIASNVRVVGKNYRNGENQNGPWEMFEVSLNNEGAITNMNTSKELYESVEMFEPYTIEFETYMKGYNVGAEVTGFHAE